MTSRAEHQLAKLQKEVDRFNDAFQVGDPVKILKDDGSIQECTVRHPAGILSGHTAIGWFTGITGAYILERVQYPEKNAEKDPAPS